MNRCAGSGAYPPVLAWALCWSAGSIVRSHRGRKNAIPTADGGRQRNDLSVLDAAAVVWVRAECGFGSPRSRPVSEGIAWRWTATNGTSPRSCARHVACAIHGTDGRAKWRWCPRPGTVAIRGWWNRCLWRAGSRSGCFRGLGRRRSFALGDEGRHRTGSCGRSLTGPAAAAGVDRPCWIARGPDRRPRRDGSARARGRWDRDLWLGRRCGGTEIPRAFDPRGERERSVFLQRDQRQEESGTLLHLLLIPDRVARGRTDYCGRYWMAVECCLPGGVS